MLFQQRFTRRSGLKLAGSALWARCARATESAASAIAGLTRSIPTRAAQALTGSQFADFVSKMDRHEREQAILEQLSAGNLPAFLRNLAAIRLNSATIFVMPEYLAIGSDTDYLRIPMNLHTATAIAKRFRFLLPTKKIVDAIYDQALCRFTPQPLPAGPQMTSTRYYTTHNAMIDTQAENRDFPIGVLAAGHKKDVVLTNRLLRMPGRIAIYGWHRGTGDPIQPLSTVHGAGYADYSHGIRLVAATALVEGTPSSLYEILQDSRLARNLSDEGAIHAASIFATA